MKMRSVAPMKVAKIGYIVMSAVFCAAGLFFIVKPDVSVEIIGILMGIAMIVFGAVKIIGYFSRDLFRLAFQFDLAFGILMAILGAIVIGRPNDLISFICVVLGVSVLADGLFKIQIALDARKFGIENWWLLLLLAVAAGAFGALLVFQSAKGAEIMTVLLGVSLLIEGVLNFSTVINTVRIVKNQRPDVIETDDYEIR